MDLVKVYVLILLGVDLLLSRTDGERLCSCYTFNKRQWLWPAARDSCKSSNKTLAVIESEQEWQFIKTEIQNKKSGGQYNEWFIGLEKNSTTKIWTWINGKSLTIDKWHKNGINRDDPYALIHKEYPKGFKGSFSSIRADLPKGWICEEETDTCQGICFVHPVLTSTSPTGTSTGTKVITTQGETSTEQDITTVPGSSTTVSTPTTAKSTYEAKSTDEAISTDEVKSTDEAIPTDEAKSTDKSMSTDKVIMDDSSSSFPSVIVVAISLGAVLFVALIILIAVIILRRKKRQGKDEESAAPKSSEKDHLAGSQYESVNPVEAAKLLRSANTSPDVSKTRYEPPPEDCEYAVVNKANKKRKEADLVYAQLAEFDHETDFAKPPKPPSYEPTVYADVEEMPPELPGREDPDSSQPTYANLETTGV